MKRALRDYEIVGVETNIPLNLFVLNHLICFGNFDTHFIAENWKTGFREDLDGNGTCRSSSCRTGLRKGSTKVAALEKTGRKVLRCIRGELDADVTKSWKNQRIHNMRETFSSLQLQE
jgi:hypothetical protein